MLEADNPTAFHITINALELNVGGQRIEGDTGMIAPFSQMRFSVKGLNSCKPGNSDLSFSIINDFGGTTAFHGATHD
jgi:chaperone protein EcpD